MVCFYQQFIFVVGNRNVAGLSPFSLIIYLGRRVIVLFFFSSSKCSYKCYRASKNNSQDVKSNLVQPRARDALSAT